MSLGKPFSLLSLSLGREAGCEMCADRFVTTITYSRTTSSVSQAPV